MTKEIIDKSMHPDNLDLALECQWMVLELEKALGIEIGFRAEETKEKDLLVWVDCPELDTYFYFSKEQDHKGGLKFEDYLNLLIENYLNQTTKKGNPRRKPLQMSFQNQLKPFLTPIQELEI